MKVPISTGREYHHSLRGAAIIAALLLFALSLNAESLWDQNFEGYIADGVSLKVGEIISVTVTPTTTLTLAASHVDSQEGRLSFTGGEGNALFSFLPSGSSNLSKEIEEESSYTLETEIPVRITGRDANGLLNLEGSRTVKLNNTDETLRISGQCAAGSVDSQKTVRFNDLYNAVLEYTSPGLRTEGVLTEADIREIAIAEAPQASPDAAAAETAGTTEAAGEVEEAQPAGPEQEAAVPPASESTPAYELSPEKQRELLLQYFNRFIDTLFTPAE